MDCRNIEEFLSRRVFHFPYILNLLKILIRFRGTLGSFSFPPSTMAESIQGGSENGKEEEEEADYMADLSLFLPPEESNSSKSSTRKIPDNKPLSVQPPNKKSKFLNWQEQRKLERERKRQEEDEQTLVNIQAPIPQSNIGFKLLKQMGYTPGTALGKEGSGRAEPVGLEIRRSRAGIGREDPHKEKKKQEEFRAEKKQKKVEFLMAEFGSRQKSQWQSRRVVINYHKAKAALDQLENKEFLEPEKNEDESDQEKEEEEEEVITEEDLLLVLTKLREEYNYCLFCGCKYDSKEELLSNCPGTDEDDH